MTTDKKGGDVQLLINLYREWRKVFGKDADRRRFLVPLTEFSGETGITFVLSQSIYFFSGRGVVMINAQLVCKEKKRIPFTKVV